MLANTTLNIFLVQYDQQVYENAMQLRKVILAILPNVVEQLDMSANMIAYCYGKRYIDMVCTIIPSKKGLKLGFYKGNELSDPHHLLEGTGKISRYINIKTTEQI